MNRFALVLSLLVLAFAAPSAALAAPAAIFTGDFTGQVAYNDPIVSPGVASAHEHCFYGVSPVNRTETEATLKDADHTSFWDVNDNRTAVWIPCVYEDGKMLQPYVGGQDRDILAYYQNISATECVPPENGAQGVTRQVQWRGTLNSGTVTSTPPSSSTDGSLVLIMTFRGDRDLGAACFPTVKVYIRFQVGAGPIGHLTFGGPSVLTPGASDDPAFVHGDYKYGHDDGFFARFLATCFAPKPGCGKNPVL